MTLRYYYRENDGEVVEITNPSRIRRQGTEASYQAEEGAVGTWTLEVDDPDGTFNVRGYRLLYAQEDEAIADDQHGVIGVWYTGDRSISRLSSESPAKRTGRGRTWSIQLHDLNTRLSWRLLIGGDTNRPNGETDLETVAWLMGTNEMAFLDPDTTYIDSTDGIGMSDNRKYSGSTLLDVLDDCAQTSGRNYGLLWEYGGNPDNPISIKLWYKHGASTDYSSAKKINNVRTEVDEVTTYYPSLDATLDRSPSRVAWGVNQLYDGGSVYRTLPSTAERFNKIDVTGRGEQVKTASAATIRADHYLATVSNVETDRIDVSVLVVPEDVNSILPFHRIQIHAEHLPGYQGTADDDYFWMRVVQRTVRDIFPDGTYELGLTLMAPSLDEFPADEGGGSGDETVLPWFAHVEGSSGPYPLPSGPIYWDKSLDQVGLPWWNTVGPFDYADIPDRDWPRYLGIEVTADAFLSTISMRATAIGVGLGVNDPYTITWEILHNGVAIAEEHLVFTVVGASNSWSGGPVVTAVNVTCAAGDIIAGRISCVGANGSAMEMFRTPLGINAGQNYLNINGGYFL